MLLRQLGNNKVSIIGEIVSAFRFSHELYGKKFYTAKLSTERASGVIDTIPVTVSDRLVGFKENWNWKSVLINGQLRSYNKREGDENRLALSVFIREIAEIEESPFMNALNYISLDGFICKETNYRKTPLGREVTDVLLAVNRPYGKSDYIPCITWGRNARFASRLEVGTHIQIEGRIQSREYLKRISDTQFEPRVVYEVSAVTINKVTETEDNENDEEVTIRNSRG